MIYLFDVNKRLKHTIPSNQIVSATYTQELNALYTFDSELPLFYKDAKTGADINLKAKFEESNYVGHFDTQGKFHLYKIYTIKVDGDMLIVKGVHIFFDEAKSTTVIEDIRLVDLGASEMFNAAFTGTGWSVKNYDNTPLTSQDFYKVVPLEARAIIIEKFKVEIHPYLEFDGQKITGKYVDIKKKLGSEVGQRFAYGHNAFNVTHEQNRAEIYTAVIGRGAPNGLNNVKETRVEFHNISWSKASGNPADKPAGSNVLELPERTAEYGHVMTDGTVKPRIGYVTFDDITDASVLLDETYKWLNENSRPKFIAVSTVDQIGNASLGDKINFIYKKIDLYFSVRIFKVVYDLLDHNNTAVELGDYDFFNTDKAAERIQGEIKRVERLSNSFISDQKAAFDAEFEAIKNEFNDKLNQAEVEANAQIQAAETRMTNDLNAQRESLSTDITNSYNNAVTYADNKAQALQSQVANDINNAKTTLSNDITASYNNAVSAAQTKVDAAKSDMTATITANKQDADSNISTLNTALGDANSRLDSTNSQVSTLIGDLNQYKTSTNLLLSDMSNVKNAVSSHTADITNLNNQIVLKASKTEVTDAVNALSFDNRNLLLDSAKEWTNPPTASNKEFVIIDKDLSPIFDKYGVNQTYTISFDMKSADVTNKNIIAIYPNPGSPNINKYLFPHTNFYNVTTEYKRYSFTFKPTLNDATRTWTKMVAYGTYNTGNVPFIRNVKVELGTRATPYSQAPEDLEAKVTKNTADITINANEITKRVLQTDYNALTNQMQTQINTATSTANENKQTIAVINGDIDNIQSWQVAKGTTIQQTADAINQKIWNTDIDNATGALQTQINTVNKTSESNTALITTVKGTVDNLDAWKTAKGTLIDQTINAVSTKVWTNDIDALQLGGRNLLLDSKNRKFNPNNVGSGLAVQNTDKSWTISTDTDKAVSVYLPLIGFMSIPKFELNKNYVLGIDLTADKDCTVTKYITNTTYTSVPVALKSGIKQRVYVNAVGKDLTPSTLIMYLNIADAKLTYDNIKVEEATKATAWTPAPEDAENKMTEIKQTADSAYLQADAIGKDYVKQSGVIVQSDGVMIGSKKVSGTEMASAISVTPSNVDIITRVMRVTGDMQVAGDIKSLSLSAVYADIANLRANVLTADSVTATALKVDQALIDKLNVNNLLVNKLTADTAMINAIKTNAVTAVRADIAWLKANVITADSITSTALKVDTALIDKLNTNELLVNKVVASTIYSDSVKTKSLEAVNANIASIRTNILVADVIQPNMLDMRNGGTAWINRLFVDTATITALTSKDAFIQNIKAMDIEAIRMRAVDNIATMNIEKGTLTVLRNDGYTLDLGINGFYSKDANSTIKFRMDKLLVSSAALGTTNSNVYLAASPGYEARVVDVSSIPSDGLAESYTYLPIRAKEFIGDKFMTNFGTNLYLGADGEIRFTSRGAASTDADIIYRDVRGNVAYFEGIANKLDGANFYLGTGNEVRVTSRGMYNDGNVVYKNLVAGGLFADFVEINPYTSSSNLYLRATNEVRLTKRGTTDQYINIRALGYTWTSSEKYKHDIEVWEDADILNKLKSVQLYTYKFKSDDKNRLRHGVILERETLDAWKNGDGVDSYEMQSYTLKGVQALIKENDTLKSEIETIKDQIKLLIEKVA